MQPCVLGRSLSTCRRLPGLPVRVRFHIIRNARTENVGKSQSCMVSNLRIIWKQTVFGSRLSERYWRTRRLRCGRHLSASNTPRTSLESALANRSPNAGTPGARTEIIKNVGKSESCMVPVGGQRRIVGRGRSACRGRRQAAGGGN